MTTGNVATLTAAKARYNGGLRLAPAEKMPLFSIASLVLATLCMISSAAHARVCIRDLKGQIVCGEPVETRDEPNDQADPRQEDRRDPPSDDQRYRRPGPPYYDEPPSYRRPQHPPPHLPDCYQYRGRTICCPKNWTVQDGACKPYRGR